MSEHFGYQNIVKAFDEDEVANSFLSEDGEGGFASGVSRMSAEISQLRQDLKEAREVMDPFAKWLEFVESHWRSVSDITIVSGDTRSAVTVGHLRRARAFLEKTGG